MLQREASPHTSRGRQRAPSLSATKLRYILFGACAAACLLWVVALHRRLPPSVSLSVDATAAAPCGGCMEGVDLLGARVVRGGWGRSAAHVRAAALPTCAQLQQAHTLLWALSLDVRPNGSAPHQPASEPQAPLDNLGLAELGDPRARAALTAAHASLAPWLRCGEPRGGGALAADAAALLSALSNVSGAVHALLAAQRRTGFAAVRRTLVATLWHVRRSAGPAWNGKCNRVYQGILVRLYLLHLVGNRKKASVEYHHVSKSGGTSMCSLAERNRCRNPRFDQDGNCLIEAFSDRPKWTLAHTVPVKHPNGTLTHKQFEPLCSYYCPQWVQQLEADCEGRHRLLTKSQWSFYSNEATTHGGSSNPASAHVCPGFLNAIVLRDALQHTLSLMSEILRLYNWFPTTRYVKWTFPDQDLNAWKAIAPAAVNNYFTRSLLGRNAFCVPLDALRPVHLSFAQAKLLSFDVVLLLGEDDLNDAAFAWGLGWRHTLRDAALRVAGRPPPLVVPPKVLHPKVTSSGGGGGGGTGRRQLQASQAPPKRSKVAFSRAQLDQIREWNALDARLVGFGRLLLQLDVALYAAIEQLGVQGTQALQHTKLGCRDGGEACLTRLLAEAPAAAAGGQAAGRANETAAAKLASAALAEWYAVGAWNARAAAWALEQHRHALVSPCGVVGSSEPRGQ